MEIWGERARYLSDTFLALTCFYLHLYHKKNSNGPLNPLHSLSVALVWYILLKWPVSTGEDNNKKRVGTSEKVTMTCNILLVDPSTKSVKEKVQMEEMAYVKTKNDINRHIRYDIGK